MTDIVSPEKRSRMMSGIRGKNTRTELLVRKSIFAEGLRFRLHRKDLPGNPDIVLPRKQVIIFVHGCFGISIQDVDWRNSLQRIAISGRKS